MIHVLLINLLFNIRFRPLLGHSQSLEGSRFEYDGIPSSEAMLLGVFALRGYRGAYCESISTLMAILLYYLLSLQIIHQYDMF